MEPSVLPELRKSGPKKAKEEKEEEREEVAGEGEHHPSQRLRSCSALRERFVLRRRPCHGGPPLQQTAAAFCRESSLHEELALEQPSEKYGLIERTDLKRTVLERTDLERTDLERTDLERTNSLSLLHLVCACVHRGC